MRAALLVALLAVPSVAAQERPREVQEPHFRVGMGISGGSFEFDTERSLLDGAADAGMFRLQFEGVSRRGIGGGVRFESVGTDDDLFTSAGFNATEAWNGTAFGHFTYRMEQHRFVMPMRVGLMSNFVALNEDPPLGQVDGDVGYWSFGPYFELAPEVILSSTGRTRGGAPKVRWSLYGEFGFGFGGTYIDVENDFREYESVTFFSGIEAGTRITLGAIELGVAYVGRWQTMDESDPEAGQVAFGYDADYQGLLLTFAVRF